MAKERKTPIQPPKATPRNDAQPGRPAGAPGRVDNSVSPARTQETGARKPVDPKE